MINVRLITERSLCVGRFKGELSQVLRCVILVAIDDGLSFDNILPGKLLTSGGADRKHAKLALRRIDRSESTKKKERECREF